MASSTAAAAALVALVAMSSASLGSCGASGFLEKKRPEGGAVPGSTIRVVTDMGWDDMGAFAVLQAAGLEPAAALATHGMMLPSAFAERFSGLLSSWNLSAQVHNGTEACFDGRACVPTDFIEDDWFYRRNLTRRFPGVVGPLAASGSTQPGSSFWPSPCSEHFTLLSLAPLSDIASHLAGRTPEAACISEIVVSGSFFAESAEGRSLPFDDNQTMNWALVGAAPVLDDTTGLTLGERAELNMGCDAWAVKEVLSSGVPLRIFPLEVAGLDRFGKQRIRDGAAPYAENLQMSFTDSDAEDLCGVALSLEKPTMLGTMACMHSSGGDIASLDFDAIAATYLWTPSLFSFARQLVRIDPSTGVTGFCSSSDSGCFSAEVATHFDTSGWLDNLRRALRLQVYRSANCYSEGDVDHGAKNPPGLSDAENSPYLRRSDAEQLVRSCEAACESVSGCTGFVTGEAEGVPSCYLRSDIRLGSCDTGSGFDTYVFRAKLDREVQAHKGRNCYSAGGHYHGAENPSGMQDQQNDPFLERPLQESVTTRAADDFGLKSCLQACLSVEGCTGFVIEDAAIEADDHRLKCYLRSNIHIHHCDFDMSGPYSTYTLQ